MFSLGFGFYLSGREKRIYFHSGGGARFEQDRKSGDWREEPCFGTRTRVPRVRLVMCALGVGELSFWANIVLVDFGK